MGKEYPVSRGAGGTAVEDAVGAILGGASLEAPPPHAAAKNGMRGRARTHPSGRILRPFFLFIGAERRFSTRVG